MRTSYLIVVVCLSLAAVAALMIGLTGPSAAQDGSTSPAAQPQNGDACWATVDGSAIVYSSAGSQAVRDAVAEAVDGDLVKVAGYCSGVANILGIDTTLFLTKSITVRGGYTTAWVHGPGAYTTTLDAQGGGSVVHITGVAVATIDSMEIMSGTAPNGGGVYVVGGSAATLSHNNIHDNQGGNGVGIMVDSGAVATVTHSLIHHNQATGGGGGIKINGGAVATVTYSTIFSNTVGEYGGGIYVVGSNGIGQATVAHCTIMNNKASSGGGIFGPGWTHLSYSTISGNMAEEGGGFFSDSNASTLTVTHSTFSDNEATIHGGAIRYTSGKFATLVNTTLSGNEAGSNGGGVYMGDRSTMSLTHCTITDNKAGNQGGGIYHSGNSLALLDTLVAGQRQADDCDGTVQPTSLGHNLDSDDTCNLSAGLSDIISGTANLEPLALNAPGETKTHALDRTSDAYDAGDCAGGDVDNDQRGLFRPQGDACDIGAYEFLVQPAIAVEKTASRTSAKVGQTITYTYRLTNTGNLVLSIIQASDDRLGDVPLFKTTLAPDEWTSGTLTYTVLPTDLPGPLTNTVDVTGTPPVGEQATARASASVPLALFQADLSISKAVESSQEALTYTIVVRNLGPDPADGATVADDVPSSVISPTWTCVSSGGAACTASGSGDIADIVTSFPAQGAVTYAVIGGITTTDEIANTATVSPSLTVDDPDLDNNTATAKSRSIHLVMLPLVLKDHAP